MKLYSYNQGSASAKALAEALGIKRLNHEGGPVRGDVINWGSSNVQRQVNGNILNDPRAVARAVNKLSAFEFLDDAGVSIPEYTTIYDQALTWLGDGHNVVARTVLNGHSGQGIVIGEGDVNAAEFENIIPWDAPLYVKYIKKTEEYRLHVMHNEVFFVQRKARKLEVEAAQVNWQVRNLAGGFIYANQDVEVGEQAKMEAVRSIMALGLDFGAVDIIYNKQEDKYYVLEVNTACGLTGTTLTKYVEQFQKELA